MQIIVDVPNSLYANLSKITNGSIATKRILDCVKYGTPLPKGHGRLIDADDIALIDEQFYVPSDYYVAERAINDAPTIIEADKAESEDKCKGCEYYLNPDYTRCHKCNVESEEQA